MIFGVGVDIISVERIREVFERWGRKFLERTMTPQEIEFVLKPSDFGQVCLRIAGTFSAKEAVFKSLRIRTPIIFKEIEILRNPLPTVNLYGRTAQISKERGICKVLVSISHEKEFAVAFAVALLKSS